MLVLVLFYQNLTIPSCQRFDWVKAAFYDQFIL